MCDGGRMALAPPIRGAIAASRDSRLRENDVEVSFVRKGED